MSEVAQQTPPSKVLVTGSAGFIGRWLCKRLADDGAQVLGIDMRPLAKTEGWEHRVADLLDRPVLAEVFESFAPDALVHLAARTDLIGKTLEDYEVNRQGVRNICELVAATPSLTRAIYTSSQLVCKVGHVPKADDEYLPSTVYGQSKVATEQIVRQTDGGGVTWCLTRPTTVWGPGMSAHYRTVLRMVEKGIFFHSGAGALCKSYSFVENITQQYAMLLQAPEEVMHRKTLYLADYEPFSLRDYVNRIAEGMGKRHPVTIPLPVAQLLGWIGDGLNIFGFRFPFTTFRLKNIRTEYIFDLSATEAACGPVPISFDEGVRRTVEWHQKTA